MQLTALHPRRQKVGLEQTLPHAQTQLFEFQSNERDFPTLNLSGCSSIIINYTVHKLHKLRISFNHS